MKLNNKVHLIGNAHIDPVWLWRWQEGYAEIKATFRSALDRMNEYPDFIFTCACAAYYKWVEENDPQMFEEIKKRVKEGRWVIAGGMWIQPDCNIPSGESFARHTLYSQRYFLQKFGVLAKVGYNVDSFGHNGMLPQILKKSGMDYYVFMRPGDHEKELPGNLFWWESMDGSRVMTYKIPISYGNWGGEGQNPIEDKILKVQKLLEGQDIDFMNFYGVGNHGGGPTIANIEAIHELQGRVEHNKLIMSSPDAYFSEMEKQNLNLPVVRDDLQHHASGCYSTHSETKANNRKAEHRLICAEKMAALANCLMNLKYPKEEIKSSWEKVLFNQFHDIMGGCSIKEAYDDAREFYGAALSKGAEIINASMQKISWAIDTMNGEIRKRTKEKDWYLWEVNDMGAPYVVFNPLSWKVKAPIQINKEIRGITDECGNPVETQRVRGSQTNKADKWNTMFMAEIPPMGYRLYWIYINKEFKDTESKGTLITEANAIENDYVRLEIEPHTGYIKKLLYKKSGKDVLRSRGAVPVVIDINHCDTWAHGIFEFHDEIGKFTDAEVKLIEEGPIRAKLRVTNRYNSSVLRQDFILYKDKEDIEVQVKLDWREKHKMLKLSFPVNVEEPKATYEIPYGFIERPVNGEEEPGQQWIDVSGMCDGDSFGLAILNDSKYSYDVKDNDMRMTVANGSIFADHFGDRDDLCEYMDQGIQEFKYSLVPHMGSWREAGVVKKAYELNTKILSLAETYHEGPLPQSFEGIKISEDNIIASVFKKSEDDDGFILRCYETNGKACEISIEVPMLNRKWASSFGPCEIKTFFIPKEKSGSVEERNLLEL